VNYEGRRHILRTRLQGAALPAKAQVPIYTLQASLTDTASLEDPDKIQPVLRTVPYARDLALHLAPDRGSNGPSEPRGGRWGRAPIVEIRACR
jgi:hypothetical protein